MKEDSQPEKMRIFLSYSSEQGNVAEQVQLRMVTSGHQVFFDRTNLRPGTDYDQTILEEIRASDLMVFLVSPHSVQSGAYTRSELRFAQETWPNPEGRVLPVLVEPTDFATIPNYLKAVTILRPDGNIPAEVSAAVNDIASGFEPGDTISGRVEQIDELEDEMQKLARGQQLTKIDQEWSIAKQQFAIEVNGKETLPSRGLAIGTALAGLGFSLFGYIGFTRSNEDFFGWSPVILPLLLLTGAAIYINVKAGQLKSAEAAYRLRRTQAGDSVAPKLAPAPVITRKQEAEVNLNDREQPD